MKNPMKLLVSIFNLYFENFKVLRATAFRLITNKNVEMPSHTKQGGLHMNTVFWGEFDNLN